MEQKVIAFLMAFFVQDGLHDAVRQALERSEGRVSAGEIARALGNGYAADVMIVERSGRRFFGGPGEPVASLDLVKIKAGETLQPGRVFDPAILERVWQLEMSLRRFSQSKLLLGRAPELVFVDEPAYLSGRPGWLKNLTADAEKLLPLIERPVEPVDPPKGESTDLLVMRADPRFDRTLAPLLQFLSDPNIVGQTQNRDVPRIFHKIRSEEIQVFWVKGKGESDGGFTLGDKIFLYEGNTFEFNASTLIHEGVHALGYVETGRYGSEVLAYRTTRDFVDIVLRRTGIDLGNHFRDIDADLIRRIPDEEFAHILKTWAPEHYSQCPWVMCAMRRQSVLVHEIKGAVGSAATFGAAYLLKEALVALEKHDINTLVDAGKQVATPMFWGQAAVFGVAARATERVLKVPRIARFIPNAIGRAVLPLAAGITAVQLLSGRANPADVALSTASFVAAGAAVELLGTGVTAALMAAGVMTGPLGWIGLGVYAVARLGVTLYLGDKLYAAGAAIFDRKRK